MTLRQRRKLETRARLLDVGRELFSTVGFEATQVGQISKGAGLAHGTFYVHFDSKEALLDQLLDESNERLMSRLAKEWGDGVPRDNAAALGHFARIQLDHWRSEAGLLRAFLQRAALDGAPPFREGLQRPLVRFMVGGLNLRVRRAGRDPELTEFLLEGLVGMWTRMLLAALEAESPDRVIDPLVAMSLGAVEGALA